MHRGPIGVPVDLVVCDVPDVDTVAIPQHVVEISRTHAADLERNERSAHAGVGRTVYLHAVHIAQGVGHARGLVAVPAFDGGRADHVVEIQRRVDGDAGRRVGGTPQFELGCARQVLVVVDLGEARGFLTVHGQAVHGTGIERRPDAVQDVFFHVEETRVHGGHHPLVARPRVHVAAQVVHVQVEHARWLGPVDQGNDAFRPGHVADFPHGEDEAVAVVDVAEAEHFRARRDGGLEGLEQRVGAVGRMVLGGRQVDHDGFRPLADRPEVDGLHPAGMIVVGRHDLVARLHVDAEGAEDHAFRRVVGEGDFVRLATDVLRHLLSHLLPEIAVVDVTGVALVVRVRPIERVDLRPVHRGRGRTARTGVHVGNAVADDVLVGHPVPVGHVVGLRKVVFRHRRLRGGLARHGQKGRTRGESARDPPYESTPGQRVQLCRILVSGIEIQTGLFRIHGYAPGDASRRAAFPRPASTVSADLPGGSFRMNGESGFCKRSIQGIEGVIQVKTRRLRFAAAGLN